MTEYLYEICLLYIRRRVVKTFYGNYKSFIIMKKMILSFALITGMFLITNLNVANASEKPSISIVTEDDGFVEVRLQDLNEKIQASINDLTTEYDVKTLKYNEEKKLAKVVLIKKDDQSTKKVYFNENGEKIEKDKDANRNVEIENIETQLPQW